MQQTVDHTSEQLAVRGVQVNLFRGGSGRPVLFLHGAGGAGVWLPFHGLLARHFDVLAPDHPGFGLSGELEHIESMDDLVYHYLALLEQLGIDEVDLVGTSLGGWLAAELAVHSPQLVRRLVLLNAVGLDIWEAPVKDLFGMNPEETVAALFADPAVAASLFPAEPDLEYLYPPGYMSMGGMRAAMTSGLRPFNEYTYKELVDLGFVIAGSPESVREQLLESQGTLGFGTLATLLQFGDMPNDRARASMELFASEVMPALKAAAVVTA